MTIDVHGHLSPPESVRRYPTHPVPRRLGDVEAMIESKLAMGVSMTVIGSPVGAGAMLPLPEVDNYAQTEDELHRYHDWLTELLLRHPRHLRGYVYVNPFGGPAHLSNAADRARLPEFVGFIANTSVAGSYLHDPAADEFFAMVAEADLPVFLHAPAAPAAGAGLTDLLMIEQLGRFCDITIGLACCVLGGWFAKYPRLRALASTGAGALGLLAEKLDLAWAPVHWDGPMAGARGGGSPLQRLPDAPSTYLRRIWADTATPSPAAIRLAIATFGPDQVLFGTDSPPLPPESVARGLAVIAELPARDAVLSGNAQRLFGSRLGGPPANAEPVGAEPVAAQTPAT